MTHQEIATQLAIEMIRKSGVRDWMDQTTQTAIAAAASAMAFEILGVEPPEEPEGWIMPSKLLITEMDGTPKQIVLRDSTDFAPATATDLRKTTDNSQEIYVQLDTTSVANNSYRQGVKIDFGENRADEYVARMAAELAATPTAGNTILLYMGWSDVATAGNGNPANLTGADAAYTGYSSNAAAAILQLDLVAVFTVTSQTTPTVQIIEGGTFKARARYGCPVLANSSGAAFHSDAVETHIVFNPVVPEGQ